MERICNGYQKWFYSSFLSFLAKKIVRISNKNFQIKLTKPFRRQYYREKRKSFQRCILKVLRNQYLSHWFRMRIGILCDLIKRKKYLDPLSLVMRLERPWQMTIMKITLIWLNVSAVFGWKDGCHTWYRFGVVEWSGKRRRRRRKQKKKGSELKDCLSSWWCHVRRWLLLLLLAAEAAKTVVVFM